MLPTLVLERLNGAKRVLLAGCGGGYDVLGAVPLISQLLEREHDVFLANLSFCNLASLPGAAVDPQVPCLFRVPPSAATHDAYCPEAWLARWCLERFGREVPSWGFQKTGAKPLNAAYQRLVAHHDLDAVVLVDGGIDAILRGDESSLGTPSEDLASLAAVSRLDVPVKLIACVGLGAEMRDGICHEQVFARIAELGARGAHLGCSTLVKQSSEAGDYLDAVDFVFANQREQRTSHIHTVVSAAVRGEYGSRGEHVWISPLLSQYWFFDLDQVAGTHLFLEHLWDTEEIWDVVSRIEGLRKTIDILPRTSMPI